ncbi:hypothetical protein H6G76_32960 [Nostoc sp. FACHB-152]|nr:hypothetical protein [Nostoc sp. FACHB-152]
MNSPWQSPIPLSQYPNLRVVMYFESDGHWVPIKYCHLSRAVEIHYRIVSQAGKEVVIFPVDLDPNLFN